jgi:hypothetical protein
MKLCGQTGGSLVVREFRKNIDGVLILWLCCVRANLEGAQRPGFQQLVSQCNSAGSADQGRSTRLGGFLGFYRGHFYFGSFAFVLMVLYCSAAKPLNFVFLFF